MTETTPCPMCSHPTLGYTYWLAQPKPRAARRRLAGLCSACARNGLARTTTKGSNINADARPQVSRELVLTDWHWLHETGELSPTDSLAHRVRQAAPRIGMSYAALEKALERAGITNPTEPTTRRRERLHECQQCRNHNVSRDRAEMDLRVLAKRLAADPDSPRLRALLADAQESLASTEAVRESHLEWDHTETEVAA